MTQLFIGLTFWPDNGLGRKVQQFRARFDTKFIASPELYMPLIHPFEIPEENLDSLIQELREETASFFVDTDEGYSIQFTGLDCITHQKKHRVYLHSLEHPDLSYCRESLLSLCNSYVVDRECKSKDDPAFLTIGRFDDPFSLENALSIGMQEFSEVGDLLISGVHLFTRTQHHWVKMSDLILFHPKDYLRASHPMEET